MKYSNRDITFGVRPLKRTKQKNIVNPLSQELLMNNYVGGDKITVTVGEQGKLEFSK